MATPRPRPASPPLRWRRGGVGRRRRDVRAGEVPVEPVRIDDVGIGGVDGVMRALATGSVDEFDRGDPVAARAQIDPAAPAAIVLDRSVGPRRRARVERHVVELHASRRARVVPGLARIVRKIEAAVVRAVKRRRLRGIDPEAVVVAVRAAERGKRLAGVARDVEADAEGVDGVLVDGIDANLAEHPAVGGRVFAHVLVGGADFPPRLAAVVAAIDFRSPDPRFHDRAAVRVALAFLRGPAGFVAVDEGVEHFRVRGGGVEADPAAHRCRRQAAVRVGPAAAAVCRFPDAALARARLDARVAPLAPHALPRCRVQRVRVRWIHHQIDGAGARALVEHLRPRPPAVGRLEDAAHLVLGPGVSGRRDVDDVRVGRVDQDAGDRVRVGEAGVAEGAAAVARLEQADPGHGRAKQVRLTRAYIQDGGIGLRHRDVADARARLMLEDGSPRGAAIVRLPDAARRERSVDASHRSDVCDRDVGGAAGDVRRSQVLPWNGAGRR